ncbi:alpha/beta hydrolase-fold protein [Croceitalea rosinachiae]|uniref:Alpha/beta hydrolase-fold protein n=1 Tax=Croceitalea rosinachiae TaxID=3075596 RepID=A0ABU3AFF3_9FLAO|nr:alpha/beta hydrolase-fold protein [Croceitalea sp. F388]MDT0608282.1 alpha/beta hydrolase-fold protein [Croceitalea sp. F388]
MKSFFFIVVTALFCLVNLNAQDVASYQKQVFEMDNGAMPYRILLPKDFDEQKQYPLILVLHGSGERGNDNESQLVHGSSLFLKDEVRENYPAIVVFPQCKANSSWAKVGYGGQLANREFTFYKKAKPTADMLLLEGLIKHLKEKYNINKDQMYVGGLSMGGMGTFELVRRNPRMFIAAFPICGGANPVIANKIKKTHWWVFHGDADEAVPPIYSTQMVNALQKVSSDVTYSLYPNVGHNSWDNAFAEAELLPWLFSISK